MKIQYHRDSVLGAVFKPFIGNIPVDLSKTAKIYVHVYNFPTQVA